MPGCAHVPVLVLSGDVHYSYLAKVNGRPIYQVVCSPIRNPLSPVLRWANVFSQFGLATLVGGLLARLARIPRPPFRWEVIAGPWFQNAVATLTLPGELDWYESSGDAVKHIDSVRIP